MDKIITFEKLLDYHAEGLSTQPILYRPMSYEQFLSKESG